MSRCAAGADRDELGFDGEREPFNSSEYCGAFICSLVNKSRISFTVKYDECAEQFFLSDKTCWFTSLRQIFDCNFEFVIGAVEDCFGLVHPLADEVVDVFRDHVCRDQGGSAICSEVPVVKEGARDQISVLSMRCFWRGRPIGVK